MVLILRSLAEWFGFAQPADGPGRDHGSQGHGGHAGGHGHTHGVVDPTITTTERGLWAVKWSFVILAVTSALQFVVVLVSGSVALLADTIHNMVTAAPLGLAFVLARRKPGPRFTYGYGRVEDFGVAFAVASVALSIVCAPARAASDHEGMAMDSGHSMSMQGMYGPYTMMREASGTSWQPDSSPHSGIMGMAGDWQTMVHGYLDAIYDHQGGPRGDDKSFSASMLMLMAQRPLASGTFGLRGMFSLDPVMGKGGYPLLLQTGETADGVTPLIDRQHPHNLFMEMAASYSVPVGEHDSVFVYAGLPGEPALGPPAFMHRFSGMDNPEAPITHHWLDSTHVTNGVVTLGYVRGDFKIEGSIFHGREPDQFRYRIEPGSLDSQSVRISYNPTANWSLQVSHGRIKSAESLEPEVDVTRTTASASFNVPFSGGLWQTTAAWGRNTNTPGKSLDAYLVESAASLREGHTLFGRIERVAKDELFVSDAPQAGQAFTVGKASLGYVHDFSVASHLKLALGGLVSTYSIPNSLDSVYGSHPVSYMAFARLKLD